MSDIERKARELLAYECPECGGEKGHDTDGVWIPCSRCCDPYTVTRHQAMQAIIAALTPPEGYVLVPMEPTEAMLKTGRAAVMAERCAGPKWTPRQHFEASGRSTAGIPEDVLDERGPLTKESVAVMVFGSMIAARPEVK
jgi:hypothetical protein